jgi:hypothetical protein
MEAGAVFGASAKLVPARLDNGLGGARPGTVFGPATESLCLLWNVARKKIGVNISSN